MEGENGSGSALRLTTITGSRKWLTGSGRRAVTGPEVPVGGSRATGQCRPTSGRNRKLATGRNRNWLLTGRGQTPGGESPVPHRLM